MHRDKERYPQRSVKSPNGHPKALAHQFGWGPCALPLVLPAGHQYAGCWRRLIRKADLNARRAALGAERMLLFAIGCFRYAPIAATDSFLRKGSRWMIRNSLINRWISDLPPEKWTPGYAAFACACSGVM